MVFATDDSRRVRSEDLAPLTRAFTLIELLTVIGIVAILAAILFPVLGIARAKGRQDVCSSKSTY